MGTNTTFDDDPVFAWLTVARRAWLYRVCAAIFVLAAGYGVVSDEHLPLWLAGIAAGLSSGTAAAHTPTNP